MTSFIGTEEVRSAPRAEMHGHDEDPHAFGDKSARSGNIRLALSSEDRLRVFRLRCENYARIEHPISPAAYSVASIWRMIATMRDPCAYLGALYPFEGLTPIVSERVKTLLRQRGFPESALNFVEFHSTEGPKHTKLMKHLIEETVTRYPEVEASILQGLDRFLAIYPIPVWETAYRRALGSTRDSPVANTAA